MLTTGRAYPRVLGPAALCAGGGLVAYLLYLVGVLDAPRELFEHGVFAALFLLAVWMLTKRAQTGDEERGAWLVFAAAAAVHIIGWATYWLFVEGADDPAYPAGGDAFW